MRLVRCSPWYAEHLTFPERARRGAGDVVQGRPDDITAEYTPEEPNGYRRENDRTQRYHLRVQRI